MESLKSNKKPFIKWQLKEKDKHVLTANGSKLILLEGLVSIYLALTEIIAEKDNQPVNIIRESIIEVLSKKNKKRNQKKL